MTSTVSAATNNEVATAAGYRVSEDPDQPGLFQWTVQDAAGRTIEGCDQSFNSQAEAWEDATRIASSDIMGALDISDEEWDAMGVEQQVECALEALG